MSEGVGEETFGTAGDEDKIELGIAGGEFGE